MESNRSGEASLALGLGRGERPETPASTASSCDPARRRLSFQCCCRLGRLDLRLRDDAIGPHLFHNQGDKSVDRLVNILGIEGVGDSRPYQYAVWIGN